jgi:hypothetical protein
LFSDPVDSLSPGIIPGFTPRPSTEKIWTAFERLLNRPTAPPTLDLGVIATQEYFRNLEPAVAGGPSVLRIIEQTLPLGAYRK